MIRVYQMPWKTATGRKPSDMQKPEQLLIFLLPFLALKKQVTRTTATKVVKGIRIQGLYRL